VSESGKDDQLVGCSSGCPIGRKGRADDLAQASRRLAGGRFDGLDPPYLTVAECEQLFPEVPVAAPHIERAARRRPARPKHGDQLGKRVPRVAVVAAVAGGGILVLHCDSSVGRHAVRIPPGDGKYSVEELQAHAVRPVLFVTRPYQERDRVAGILERPGVQGPDDAGAESRVAGPHRSREHATAQKPLHRAVLPTRCRHGRRD
jgi:hypothetical protein